MCIRDSSALARACREAGITFIGPPPEVLDLAGNKVTALAAARAVGIPVLQSSAPSDDTETLLVAADQIGFPLFVKAVAGGGGVDEQRKADLVRGNEESLG